MTFLTIFTAPKPFTDPHIAALQRNAIESWSRLGEAVQVILVGEEIGMAEAAAELGVQHVRQVKRNPQGTPLVNDIFEQARRHSESPILAYVNADVILLPDFLEKARSVDRQMSEKRIENYLVVGQRWDLDMRLTDGSTQRLDFHPGWADALRNELMPSGRGRLHPAGGSDYFIFPRHCFSDMPAFAIGRAGWDNWMLFHARRQGWHVINATPSLQVVHQDHDYSHLPGGQSHYRLPETAENIRLAGGRRTIFTLRDTNYQLSIEGVVPLPLDRSRMLREVETWSLRRVHGVPGLILAEVSFAIFHPVKAWQEWRGRLVYVVNKRFSRKTGAVTNKTGSPGGKPG